MLVAVAVGVFVGTGVAVLVGAGVAVSVAVFVAVGVGVLLAVGVGVAVGGCNSVRCSILAAGLVLPVSNTPYSMRIRPWPPSPALLGPTPPMAVTRLPPMRHPELATDRAASPTTTGFAAGAASPTIGIYGAGDVQCSCMDRNDTATRAPPPAPEPVGFRAPPPPPPKKIVDITASPATSPPWTHDGEQVLPLPPLLP